MDNITVRYLSLNQNHSLKFFSGSGSFVSKWFIFLIFYLNLKPVISIIGFWNLFSFTYSYFDSQSCFGNTTTTKEIRSKNKLFLLSYEKR